MNRRSDRAEPSTQETPRALRDAATEIARIANETPTARFELVKREGRGHVSVERNSAKR